MPQMAPLWWTFIMFLTLIVMLSMIMCNYFSFLKKLKTKKSISNFEMNWKW